MFCIAIDSTNSTNNQPLSNTSADLHLCLLTENTGNYLTPGSGLLLVLSSLGDHCSSESTHKGERSGVQYSVESSFVWYCCAECTKQ
ncbi:Zinc finger protein [Trichinella pseudospiralis]